MKKLLVGALLFTSLACEERTITVPATERARVAPRGEGERELTPEEARTHRERSRRQRSTSSFRPSAMLTARAVGTGLRCSQWQRRRVRSAATRSPRRPSCALRATASSI